MKAIVLHVNSSSATSTSPTMRIARYAAKTLNLPLIHNKATAVEALGNDEIDVLLIKHGMLKFSDHRSEALELYKRSKMIINLENDYTFLPDARFTRILPTGGVWGTVKRDGSRLPGASSHYVNWNVLTMLPPEAWAAPVPFTEPSHGTLLYYGAYRPGRQSSFERYLKHIRATVSTYRGKTKFLALNPNLNVIAAFRDPMALANFPVTLYIEDDFSHNTFTSPANRFYECLQLGVAMAFDFRTVPTLESAGFDANDFSVANEEHLLGMMSRWRQVRVEQRKRWHRNFELELRQQVLSAAEAYGIHP